MIAENIMLCEDEGFITLTAAAKLPILARNGKRPGTATMWRWAHKGVRGIKLETIVIGGARCTSAAAVVRFIERLTAASNGETIAPEVRTPSQRQKAVKAAEARLTKAGIIPADPSPTGQRAEPALADLGGGR